MDAESPVSSPDSRAVASPVAWGGMRRDVVGGLRTLTTLEPGQPERDPEFTDAVHALVDEPGWDHRDPRGFIGLVLRDVPEADLAREAVTALVTVLDALGPEAEYDAYLEHPGWTLVQSTSAQLLAVMTGTAEF